MMEDIYEILTYRSGEIVLKQMVPLKPDPTHANVPTFFYRGTCVVGQVQGPEGMQTVESAFEVKVEDKTVAGAFDKAKLLIAEAVNKCRADFKKQMGKKKILTPYDTPLPTQPLKLHS